ncbi:hypothetical protein IQ07DRAFT_592041 [Pyrenochaeta sp. DS3sAY3a]|nr:hypothetical protein IQ07DRAFT_592041 [Pyrenochaeta sp. DS3sAY3a]
MAFTGPPRIIRIWGDATPIENGTPEFTAFTTTHSVPVIPGSRSIIVVNVHQCGTSCGYSVPYYDFKGHRSILDDFFAKKAKKFDDGNEKESMDAYWAWKSQASIDGLPGMKRGVDWAKKNKVAPLKKMVGPYAPRAPRTVGSVEPIYLLIAVFLGIVIGGAMALSVVTPERLRALQQKGQLI